MALGPAGHSTPHLGSAMGLSQKEQTRGAGLTSVATLGGTPGHVERDTGSFQQVLAAISPGLTSFSWGLLWGCRGNPGEGGDREGEGGKKMQYTEPRALREIKDLFFSICSQQTFVI